MKLVDIIRDANSNLLRSKARTTLTIIAIFIGAMTLTITNGIGQGVSKYIDQQLGNIGAEDVIVVQPKMEESFNAGPQEYDPEQASSVAGGYGFTMPLLQDRDVKNVASVPGVINAEPLLSATPDYIVGPSTTKFQLMVSAYIAGTNLELSSGQLPNNGSAQNELTLPSDYVSALGFSSAEDAVGATVDIGITSASGKKRVINATVVGVQGTALINLGGANVNDALIRSLSAVQAEGQPAGMPQGSMAVIARVAKDASDEEMDKIKKDIEAKDYTAQTVQDQIGMFKQVISAIIAVLNFFAIIALLAASFGIVNTLLMAVQERTKEIGLMKAMGLSKNKIFLLFSIEAILLGFWGSLIGSLAGIGVGLVANNVASETFLKDLPGFSLTSFSVVSVVVIMVIIMTIAFIAGTVPARRASRKNPIDALRYE